VGFVALALYFDPAGMARLNPFGGENCSTYEQQRSFNKQQQTHKQSPSNEGGKTSAEQDAGNAGAQAPEHQGSEADYYACRLAVYTHQLALFTAALVVVTVILIGTGIYQGLHLGRAANAAKDSADALPVLERAYVFIRINSGVVDWIRGIVESELAFRDKNVVRAGVSRVPIVDYQIINHGKTPAIVQAMSADLVKSAVLLDIRYNDDVTPGEIVIPAGESFPPAADGRHALITYSGPITNYHKICRLAKSDASGNKTDIEIDGRAAEALKEGRTFLWFYGHVVYEDIFGEERETCFCWRYDGRAGTFQQHGRKENRRT
jgi:hypothetical protein